MNDKVLEELSKNIIKAVLEDAEVWNCCEHCMNDGVVYADVTGQDYTNLVEWMVKELKKVNQ